MEIHTLPVPRTRIVLMTCKTRRAGAFRSEETPRLQGQLGKECLAAASKGELERGTREGLPPDGDQARRLSCFR